jgi:hypothetical protein
VKLTVAITSTSAPTVPADSPSSNIILITAIIVGATACVFGLVLVYLLVRWRRRAGRHLLLVNEAIKTLEMGHVSENPIKDVATLTTRTDVTIGAFESRRFGVEVCHGLMPVRVKRVRV